MPGEEIDGWDRARQQKRGNIQRLKDLFERELKHVEESEEGSITAPSMDALTKLGALVQRWDALERARLNLDRKDPETDRPKLFLEDMEFVAEVLREVDPEGLKVIAKNFDTIISRFKEEHA